MEGNLLCGFADYVVHEHNASCFDEDGTLACLLPEVKVHEHSDDCYQVMESEEPELVCEKETIQLHSHSDICYESYTDETGTEQEMLICNEIEVLEHIHDESCYVTAEDQFDDSEDLTCTLTENHQHSDDCYNTAGVLICGETENHIHGPMCWGTWQLVCGKEEHTHDLRCRNDSEADVETEEVWTASFAEASMTGDWAQDAVAIAQTQLGYTESTQNYAVMDDGQTIKGYTRYGAWYGDPYADWDAMFVSFCLNYAGVEDFPLEGNGTAWLEVLTQEDEQLLFQEADFYTPAPGDIIFFGEQDEDTGDLEVSSVGLVAAAPEAGAENNELTILQGDCDDKVAEFTVETDDETILGYGVLPVQEFYCELSAHQHKESCYGEDGTLICGKEVHLHSEICSSPVEEPDETEVLPENLCLLCQLDEHTHSSSCYTEGSGQPVCDLEEHTHDRSCYGKTEASFTYEDESIAVQAEVFCAAGIPLDTTIGIEKMSADNSSYISYEAYAQTNTEEGQSIELDGYWIRFYLDEEEILLPEAQITAELTVKPVAAAQAETDEDTQAQETAATRNLTGAENQASTFALRTNSVSAEEAEKEVQTDSAEETEGTDEASGEPVTVTVLQTQDEVVSEQGAVDFEEYPEGKTLSLTLGQSRTFALLKATEANYEFRVEYYANLERFVYDEDAPDADEYALEIIDTRGDGNGTGGHLPQNGSLTNPYTENGIMYLQLEQTDDTTSKLNGTSELGNYTYVVDTTMQMTKVYNPENATYQAGLNMNVVNNLRDNKCYELTELWILTWLAEGASNTQTNAENSLWTVYVEQGAETTVNQEGMVGPNVTVNRNYAGQLEDAVFTNNEASADPNNGVFYVGPDKMIRLVYSAVEGKQNVFVNMFDYNISDGNKYTNSGYSYPSYTTALAAATTGSNNGIVYMNTNEDGINADSAYVNDGSDTATRLTFGNQNTAVDHSNDTLNGYYINGSNTGYNGALSSFKYCSFGLVTGYNISTDTLTYAPEIAHQALFNDETYYAISRQYKNTSWTPNAGKQTYTNNVLNFRRIGDTYILTGVNEGRAVYDIQETDLDEFYTTLNGYEWGPNGYTENILYTNGFWPMDGVTSDDDTGKDMLFGETGDETRGYTNYDSQVNPSATTGILAESEDGYAHNSYFGMQYSVEFTLDNKYCGPLEYLFYGDDDMWVFLTDLATGVSRQICDIGGVHGSVGSFTNLWDYIPADSTGDYRLTFFYTERGATGSSCFMQFTLPEVSSVVQNTYEYGSVQVTKDVPGEDPDAKFEFTLYLDGEHDNNLYSYTIDGVSDTSGTITDGGSFTLKDGEIITISGLPEGMKYKITESTPENYQLNWKDSSGAIVVAAASGTVVGNTTHSYTAVNQPLGSLSLKKIFKGDEGKEEYTFQLTLTDANGTPVSGTYSTIVFDERGEATVTLKAGQTVTISGLPAASLCKVEEVDASGYIVSYSVGDKTSGTAPTVTIEHGNTVAVTVTNTLGYALPDTGGNGIQPLYTFGLVLLNAAAVMCLFKFGRKRRKEGKFVE